ncbi:MAG TPA: pyridoxamine 5'-phosphate oxidase family protein [Streptosporangiaceae bacterium]|nr:pyridoxamine 5'-phosphate oxidase family protein [Streptosporangiaceae bacterium]
MDMRSGPLGGGDLGRRILEQRRRAGLTRRAAAGLAGMSGSYLRYLETSPAPRPTPGDLDRLAGTLGTTPASLLGVGLAGPPGQTRPSAPPQAEPLSPEQCQDYLGGGGVGRLVFTAERGPVAEPVSYRMHGPDIVFRTSARSELAAAAAQPRVSFEVDQLDDVLAEGWSVLVSGRAAVVTDPVELAELVRLGVRPWAGGEKDCYLRIVADEVSGRRIRSLAG